MHIRPTVAIRRSTLVLIIVATVTGVGHEPYALAVVER